MLSKSLQQIQDSILLNWDVTLKKDISPRTGQCCFCFGGEGIELRAGTKSVIKQWAR